MSASDPTTQRICPECGSANSKLSLFCAECGASLNGGADAAPSPAPSPAARFDVEEDPQQTQPLTGGIPDREPPSPWALNGSSSARWSPDSTETAYTSPINATSVSTPPIATRFDVDSTAEAMNPGRTDVWAADYDGPSPGIVTDQGEYAIEEESLRGFFLGVTAIVLIIIIAAIYGWTITPDGSFRDTIQGWINDIS